MDANTNVVVDDDTSRVSIASGSTHSKTSITTTSKRSSQNFIEKNKSNVSRIASAKNRTALDPEADSSVVIKCLNEVETNNSKKATKTGSTKTTIASKTIVKVKPAVSENLSSSRASTTSTSSTLVSAKRVEVKQTQAIGDSKKLVESSAPIELEISIISNHSSIVPDKPASKAVLSPKQVSEMNREVNKQQIRNFLQDLNRMHEKATNDPAPSITSHSSPVSPIGHLFS